MAAGCLAALAVAPMGYRLRTRRKTPLHHRPLSRLRPFAVVLRENDNVLGYGGFLHHREVPNEIEIGYRLDPAYWNRGLITEAVRTVCNHAFLDLRLPRVISLIHPDNAPSRRVAEKIGMRLEKRITFRGFPTNLFALSRDQWLASGGA